jgi:hypothetical protein
MPLTIVVLALGLLFATLHYPAAMRCFWRWTGITLGAVVAIAGATIIAIKLANEDIALTESVAPASTAKSAQAATVIPPLPEGFVLETPPLPEPRNTTAQVTEQRCLLPWMVRPKGDTTPACGPITQDDIDAVLGERKK